MAHLCQALADLAAVDLVIVHLKTLQVQQELQAKGTQVVLV
jgi:hypothetical protein